MELVSSKEIAKVVHLDKYGFVGTFMGWILLKVLRISKLNRIYKKHKNKHDGFLHIFPPIIAIIINGVC